MDLPQCITSIFMWSLFQGRERFTVWSIQVSRFYLFYLLSSIHTVRKKDLVLRSIERMQQIGILYGP